MASKKQLVVAATVVAALMAGAVGLAMRAHTVAAYWLNWDSRQVVFCKIINNEEMSGWIEYRFDTGYQTQVSSTIQTYWCGGSGVIYAAELFTDAAGYDRCLPTVEFHAYSHAEAIVYNYFGISTYNNDPNSGIGAYQDCNEGQNHEYKWRGDFWADNGIGWETTAAEFVT